MSVNNNSNNLLFNIETNNHRNKRSNKTFKRKFKKNLLEEMEDVIIVANTFLNANINYSHRKIKTNLKISNIIIKNSKKRTTKNT